VVGYNMFEYNETCSEYLKKMIRYS